jgi:hypothetical protein
LVVAGLKKKEICKNIEKTVFFGNIQKPQNVNK